MITGACCEILTLGPLKSFCPIAYSFITSTTLGRKAGVRDGEEDYRIESEMGLPVEFRNQVSLLLVVSILLVHLITL